MSPRAHAILPLFALGFLAVSSSGLVSGCGVDAAGLFPDEPGAGDEGTPRPTTGEMTEDGGVTNGGTGGGTTPGGTTAGSTNSGTTRGTSTGPSTTGSGTTGSGTTGSGTTGSGTTGGGTTGSGTTGSGTTGSGTTGSGTTGGGTTGSGTTGSGTTGSGTTGGGTTGSGTTGSGTTGGGTTGSGTGILNCDLDGDGYLAVQCGGDDCCDVDPDVYPGQATWFTFPNQCGSYDYDCDGRRSRLRPPTSCRVYNGACYGEGYMGAVACGMEGLLQHCSWQNNGCAPDPFNVATEVQACK